MILDGKSKKHIPILAHRRRVSGTVFYLGSWGSRATAEQISRVDPLKLLTIDCKLGLPSDLLECLKSSSHSNFAITSQEDISMLLHQTESQVQQKPELSAIVMFLFEIVLLVAIYSIGVLITESWIVLIWAGRLIARILTQE